MTRIVKLFVVAFSLIGLAACAKASAPTAASEQLHALFKQSDEDNLRLNPLSALARGDLRYADQLGDFVSQAHFDAERAAHEHELRQLTAIDRSRLSPIDQLAYDVFKWRTELSLRQLAPDMLALTAVRPLDHFTGFHNRYPDFASGQGGAPFKTLADYENNLKRNHQYVQLLDKIIGRFREGMASGVVQPKLTVQRMIDQLDAQLPRVSRVRPSMAR